MVGASQEATYHLVWNRNNTMSATSGVQSAYPSGALQFIRGFKWGSCCSIFRFLCNVLKIIFCPCPFFIWPMKCLSVLDLRLLILSIVISKLFFNVKSEPTDRGMSSYGILFDHCWSVKRITCKIANTLTRLGAIDGVLCLQVLTENASGLDQKSK